MKLSFIFVFFGVLVTVRTRVNIRFEHSSSESDEPILYMDTVLDFRGSVRRNFALEAAFVDHARNMICSPLSVMMPLAKLVLGAQGAAEVELLNAVGMTNRNHIKRVFGRLINDMEYLPGVSLDVASRLFISREQKLNATFHSQAIDIFKSSCQKVNPENPTKTAQQINDWVARKTNQKITKLINPSDISRDLSLVLVNAIYFAGTWKEEFEKARPQDFHSPSGTRRIPMMTHEGDYKYRKCDTLNAQLIEIPYEGDQSAMIVVLPYSNSGLPVLLRALKLAPELLNSALGKMRRTHVILSMPKFKIETQLNLNDLYKKIGLSNIFDRSKSQLKNVVERDTVYVSKSTHKAVIEVNEKGTNASAATGMELMPVIGYLNIIKFNVDRPFLFTIRAYQEQLFTGVYYGN